MKSKPECKPSPMYARFTIPHMHVFFYSMRPYHPSKCGLKKKNKETLITLFFFSICFRVGSCRDNSWLCIGSTDGLYVIDLATSELQTVIYFTGRVCGEKISIYHLIKEGISDFNRLGHICL